MAVWLKAGGKKHTQSQAKIPCLIFFWNHTRVGEGNDVDQTPWKHDWHNIHLSPGNQNRAVSTEISINSEKLQVIVIRLHSLNSPDVSTEVRPASDMVRTLLPQYSTLSPRETEEAGKPLSWLWLFMLKQGITRKSPLPIFPWSGSSDLGKSSFSDPLKTSGWQVSPCIQR